ncbi:MAG: hypothetical protein EHM56_13595, partial [Chloroflexi bacterium]
MPGASVRQVAAEGQVYDLLEIEGLELLSEEGKPRLPFAAALVAVPPGAEVSLEVVDAPAEVLPGSFHILPQPALEVEVPLVEPSAAADSLPRSTGLRIVEDEAVYAGDGWFPSQPVGLGQPAFLRSQRVVGLRFYPLQVNPSTGEVRQARHVRIRLRLSYEGGTARSAWAPAQEPQAFESLLRSAVVNYEAAAGWRAAPEPAGLARSTGTYLPPVPGYRLAVDQDGLYQLTYSTLAAAGVPVDRLDPRTFQVFCGGEEVAICVVGEEDGTFGPPDAVLFWGEGLDDKYARENVYWLGYGQALGLRMATRLAGSAGGAPLSASTRVQDHFEQNVGYWSLMPGDDALERFYWMFASAPGSMVQTVSLGPIAAVPATASLRVALAGYTSSSAVAPDHHVQVYVNEQFVGDVTWDGTSYKIALLDFPQEHLQAGDNKIRFQVPGDTGAAAELDLVDWFEIHYQRPYEAGGDLLRFGGDSPGEWAYQVTNFTAAEIELLDITEPRHPETIQGALVTPAG